VPVSLAVNGIGSGRGAHVNVRAAGRTLLGVVHRSVDVKFLNGLWSGSRQRLPNGEIGDAELWIISAVCWRLRQCRIVHDAAEATELVVLPLNRLLHRRRSAGRCCWCRADRWPNRLIPESGVGTCARAVRH